MLLSTGSLFGNSGGAPAVPMTYSYVTATNDNTNASSYTFTGHSIGTAAAGRFIAVAITTTSTTVRTVSSVTIDGNAMTKGPEAVGGSSTGCATWTYLLWATGTTADIVVTLSGVALSCTIMVYNLIPVSGTPVDTVTGTGSPGVVSDLEVKTSGLALFAGISSAAGTTLSWSGVNTPTKDTNGLNNDSNRPSHSWSIPTTENDGTRDATFATGSFLSVAGISFQ